jgi:hypothetical protein
VAIDPDVFVPEKYVRTKEILVPFMNLGLGVIVPLSDLHKGILQKRFATELILNRDFTVVIHETAVPPDQ